MYNHSCEDLQVGSVKTFILDPLQMSLRCQQQTLKLHLKTKSQKRSLPSGLILNVKDVEVSSPRFVLFCGLCLCGCFSSLCSLLSFLDSLFSSSHFLSSVLCLLVVAFVSLQLCSFCGCVSLCVTLRLFCLLKALLHLFCRYVCL